MILAFAVPLKLQYLLLPFVSAFIGWLTNWLAIQMLFHPRQPVRLGFMTLQGVLPKRKPQLAAKLGEIVERELFSHDDIEQALRDPEVSEALRASLREKMKGPMQERLTEKLLGIHPMAKMFVTEERVEKLCDKLLDEIDRLLESMAPALGESLRHHLHVGAIVQEKVEAFSMEKLEEVLYTIMRREFVFVEIVGGVLGFVIGAAQLALLQAL